MAKCKALTGSAVKGLIVRVKLVTVLKSTSSGWQRVPYVYNAFSSKMMSYATDLLSLSAAV